MSDERPAAASEPHLELLRRAPRVTAALQHIAMHPGASNRAIADGIGVRDEGQVSRLLARVDNLGLVVNRVERRQRGGPNAWYLTVDGRRLVTALRMTMGAPRAPARDERA